MAKVELGNCRGVVLTLLLDKLAAGVMNGNKKSIKVIDAIAIRWTAEANSLLAVEGRLDGAACHRAGLRRNFVCPLAPSLADNKFRRGLS